MGVVGAGIAAPDAAWMWVAPNAEGGLLRRGCALRGAGALWTDDYLRGADARRTNSARSRLKRSAAW
jgi:hypothetical protein